MRRALALNNEDPDILNALGYFLTDTKRSLKEARQLLEKANTLAPNKYHILDSLGWLAFREGKMEQAKTLLEQAYRLQADSEILTHWLTVLVNMGNKVQAKNLAEEEGKKFTQDSKLQTVIQQIMNNP
jgi:Flp pilus assembly protein TadD